MIRLFRAEQSPRAPRTSLPEWQQQAYEAAVASGQKPPNSLKSRWFGPKDEAQWYWNDAPNPVMKAVNVPETVAQTSQMTRQPSDVAKWSRRPTVEYMLPPEWANRAQEIPWPTK